MKARLIVEDSRVDEVPGADLLAGLRLRLGEPRVRMHGWWFIVIIQKKWSSYSVIVLPGQCLYRSPGSKSSK